MNTTYSEEGAGAGEGAGVGAAGRKRWSIKHCFFALGSSYFQKKYLREGPCSQGASWGSAVPEYRHTVF
jgi:hypothetical protein